MNKPTKFMIQVTVNYTDDSGQSLERRFNSSDQDSYEEFMAACHKVYESARYTFGPEEFDKIVGKKEEPEEEPKVDNVQESTPVPEVPVV